MTLLLTELSSMGISMAADSAVTYSYPICRVDANGAQKLQVISHLNAGISCWGLGCVNNIPTDQWLSEFIESSSSFTKLQSFADELTRLLNLYISPNNTDQPRMGFHLAGYENFNGNPVPSFYHIHDKPVNNNSNQKFNVYQDISPEKYCEITSKGDAWITRNGDFFIYANIFGLLEDFFQKLITIGIKIPHSQNLVDRADYLVFQIRTISEIYRLSNLPPGIGGAVHYLTINPEGIQSRGIRYF